MSDKPKDYNSIIKICEKEGCEFRTKGSHTVAKKDGKGSAVIPFRRGEYPKGTLHSIYKQLAAMGIILTITFIFYFWR